LKGHIIAMLSPLYLQIPIFLFLLWGAYTDYKTRTVSNKIILGIIILSLPMIWNQTSWLIPILLCLLFLGLFYFTNQIGGADTKVFIPLMLGMSTNDIFIFFFLFSISNLFLMIKFWKGIPLFISILFGC
jgi:Flp pilus assembly protein protease CpaA